MLNEEVVLLDSDDEKDSKEMINPTDMNKNVGNDNDKNVNGDDIVMEYNHNEYADLVGPLRSNQVSNPNPPPSKPAVPSIKKLPKRPGTMPPFALFSQEMREKLQKDDPNIGFGDLGRKLGEMWHALTEDQKEEYRKKARQIADERMKTWKAQMNAISPTKRKMLENQQKLQVNKIKKKRTSGYSIFCSEYRRKLAQEQPDLSFADISKTVADDWRDLSQEKKNSYELRAQRYNAEEEKRWRSRMMAQQQQQMRMRQQMVGSRGRGGANVLVSRGRGRPVITGGGATRGGMTGYRNIMPKTGVSSSGAGSGLVISSVSSLSAQPSSSQGSFNLPSGISISKAADPDINLPKSISISRVEPEIQIVEESVVRAQQGPVQQQRVMSRGRVATYQPRGRATHVRPTIAPRGMGMVSQRGGRMVAPMRGRGVPGRGGVMVTPGRGRGMSMVSPVKRMGAPATISPAMGVSPLKRMASNLSSPVGVKRPRMPMAATNNLNFTQVQGAVNPSSLDVVGRLCRLCGVASPIIFWLKDRRALITKISQVCNLDIDIEADTQSDYPGVICRKCVNLVETFHNFQLTVGEGQKMIAKRVEARQRAQEAQEVVQLADTEEIMIRVHSPESIGLDPLESILPDDTDSNSILPDSDNDNITIKQEKITSSNSSSENGTKSSEKSLTSDKDAPMTSLFSDAMTEMTTVKVEPDITGIKQEMKEQNDEQPNNAEEPFENIEITPVVDQPSDESPQDESKEKSNTDEKVAENTNKEATENAPASEVIESMNTSVEVPVKEGDEPEDKKNGDLVGEENGDKETTVNSEELPTAETDDNAEEPQDTDSHNGDSNDLFSDYPQPQEEDGPETVNGIDGGDLFSDYPDFSGNGNGDNQENGVEMPEDIDWFPSEDLEDIPGVEVRSMVDDFGDGMDVVPDPLFEMEDSRDEPPNGEAVESVVGAGDISNDVAGNIDEEHSEVINNEGANNLADQISDESDAEEANQDHETSGDVGSCMEESLNEECDADNGYPAESFSEPKVAESTENS